MPGVGCLQWGDGGVDLPGAPPPVDQARASRAHRRSATASMGQSDRLKCNGRLEQESNNRDEIAL